MSEVKYDGSGGGGCLGCIGLILCIFVIWGLIFGITVGGRHYGMKCSVDRGVEFK